MKKIAFLLPDFYKGGMPRVASNLIKKTINDFNVELILFNSEDKLEFETHGIEVIKMFPLGKNKISKIFVYCKRIFLLKKLKRNRQYDLVISFGVSANIANILTKKVDKVVITEHNIKSIENRNWGFFGRIYDYFIKIFYNHAEKIITVSEGIKLDLIEKYGIENRGIITIENPMDIDSIIKKSLQPLQEDIKSILNEKFNILVVGRFSKEKGHISALKILKNLSVKYDYIQLLFLGNGELEKNIKQWIIELQIESKVIFLGYTDNPFNIMKYSDCLLIPSLHEGLSNVIIESLIAGTPVIATDCLVGPRETLLNNDDYKNELLRFKVVDDGIITRRLKNNVYKSLELLTDEENDMYNAIELCIQKKVHFNNVGERVGKYSLDNIYIRYKVIFDSILKEEIT